MSHFKWKCTKFHFHWGFAALLQTLLGVFTALPSPQTVEMYFKGPREGGKGERRGREVKEEKGRRKREETWADEQCEARARKTANPLLYATFCCERNWTNMLLTTYRHGRRFTLFISLIQYLLNSVKRANTEPLAKHTALQQELQDCSNFYVRPAVVYRVGQKLNPKCSTHNFVKSWRFAKFFHCYNLQKICNAAVVKYPTTNASLHYLVKCLCQKKTS